MPRGTNGLFYWRRDMLQFIPFFFLSLPLLIFGIMFLFFKVFGLGVNRKNSKGDYMFIGMIVGMSIGALIGMFIYPKYGITLGLSIGLTVGMYIGMLIPRR
jgi:hypothetical protein